MQIFVRAPFGFVLTLEADPCDTFGDVKKKLKQKSGSLVPEASIILLLMGGSPSDGETLKGRRVQPNTTLNCVFGGLQTEDVKVRTEAEKEKYRCSFAEAAADAASGNDAALEVLEKMRSDGIDPNEIVSAGATALVDCITRLHAGANTTKEALLLLRYGADPNLRCQYLDAFRGGSCLHIAVRLKSLPHVKLLLAAGARTDDVDCEGRTPEDYADAECGAYIKSFRAGNQSFDLYAGSLSEAAETLESNNVMALTANATRDGEEAVVALVGLSGEIVNEVRISLSSSPRELEAATAEKLKLGNMSLLLPDGRLIESSTAATLTELFEL